MVDFDQDKMTPIEFEVDPGFIFDGLINLVMQMVEANVEGKADMGGCLLPGSTGNVAIWVTVRKESTDDMKWGFAACLQRRAARLAGVPFVDPFDEVKELREQVAVLQATVDRRTQMFTDEVADRDAIIATLTAERDALAERVESISDDAKKADEEHKHDDNCEMISNYEGVHYICKPKKADETEA